MNHEYYMQLALDLAIKGFPAVSPNPAVGSVIVYNDEVVSSGFHQQYGGPHAEVNAINALPKNILPADCTLYVTLEPCNHHGKTPPCTDLILKAGFKKVVVACKDPNPQVSGEGLKRLTEAGIAVTYGILENAAREVNKHFITFHENKRPYIVLKWAQTADGFISRHPVPAKREDNLISGQETQVYVHGLRANLMAVLVGKNTVLADDPSLTTRLVKGRNPVRLFIDRHLEVPAHFNIFDKNARTVVFNEGKNGENDHVTYIRLDFSGNVSQQILSNLYRLNIQSVLVEGGAILLNDLVNQDLWDEVLVFQNPHLNFVEGIKAPVFAIKNTFEVVGNDKLYKHVRNESLSKDHPIENEKEIF